MFPGSTFLPDFPTEKFRRIIDVNLTGYFVCAKAVAPDVPSATTLHHQTTWVAVIGTAGTTAPTKVTTPTVTPVAKPPTSSGSGALAATGASTGVAGAAVLLVGAGAVRRRRRRTA